jgi:DNA-binding beta-propeller fold protein YncE
VLYVTDTGRNRVYRIAGGRPSVVLEDSTLNRPNGITWDRAGGRLIVLPYGGRQALFAWRPGQAELEALPTTTGGKYDGVEVLEGGAVLVSSQADSTLVIAPDGTGRIVARTAGAPADIGVDTRRNRVAVPYIALNRVDIWELPR